MSRAVLDASAAVYVIVEGQADPRGPALRSALEALEMDHGIRAPSLVAYEVGQVVHVKDPDAYGADVRARQDAVDTVLRGIERVPATADGTRRTGGLAERHGLSFYDAAYLELAARDGSGILITEDRRLKTAAVDELGTARAFDIEGIAEAVRSGALRPRYPNRSRYSGFWSK